MSKASKLLLALSESGYQDVDLSTLDVGFPDGLLDKVKELYGTTKFRMFSDSIDRSSRKSAAKRYKVDRFNMSPIAGFLQKDSTSSTKLDSGEGFVFVNKNRMEYLFIKQ